ncbi:MAG: hypothetical protein M3217_00620, partial [Actinomycetota bacterium]|nr:hypothetical protein [Actinomycetota bacterium]
YASRCSFESGVADARRLHAVVSVATPVAIVGQVVDLQWHATHPEFETAADQLEAHWLVWIGQAALLALAVAGLRISSDYRPLVGAGVFLAIITVVHFVAHAMESDPEVIHVFLAAAKAATLAGVVWVTVKTPPRAPAGDAR